MLSTQPSNLPGQHRRQNSTPTVLDTLKVPLFPATRPPYGSHRRSLSVDQPTNIQQQQKTSSQDDRKVIIKRHEQQYLRETQQHQQQLVRPGQNQQQPRHELHFDRSLKAIPLDSYLGYGSGTSTHPCFQSQAPEWDDKHQLDLHQPCETGFLNNIKLDSNIFAGYLDGFEYETLDEAFDDELKNGTTIESSVAHKNMLDEGIPPHASRGRTARRRKPLSQPDNSFFPMTPSTSPISKINRSQRIFEARTASSSPTRKTPNLKIKAPQAMKRGSSCQDKLNVSKAAHGLCKLPSPPHSARGSYSSSATFPPLGFLDMSGVNVNFSSRGTNYVSSQCSPLSNALPPMISSFQSSPEMSHLPQFCSKINELSESSNQRLRSDLETNHDADLRTSKDCARSSTQSDSEVDRDTSVEDTCITSEEIVAFMYGPSSDNRWSCTFPGCTRTFGRKENIKSHIQNHLGDRQFICSLCGNDFVRQHDLKRHMKIHSGVKPYTCPCGRTFCRHDALTRHRQRNTCEGGFSGILKSPTKRGRPKKVRPDSDQRLAKSAKTRQRALEKAYGKVYQSSSGSSVCSFSSPPYMPDEIIIRGTSPLDDVESLRANLTEFLSSTPPTSPSHSIGNSFSSQSSKLSTGAIRVGVSPSPKIASIQEESQDMLLTHAMSRETSTSYYGTPPELDLSCSSPLAPNFLEFDSECTTVTGAAPIVTLPETKASSSDLDISASNRELDQMFMDSISSSSSPDKDPLFILENFEDPFTSSSSWQDGFDENPDSFFDSL